MKEMLHFNQDDNLYDPLMTEKKPSPYKKLIRQITGRKSDYDEEEKD